jgi:hypothetical protein
MKTKRETKEVQQNNLTKVVKKWIKSEENKGRENEQTKKDWNCVWLFF